jgi:hypothetical protein
VVLTYAFRRTLSSRSPGALYRELPETPLRVSLHDHKQAAELHLRGIPLELIEAALLLGSLRRLLRPPGALTLSPIRSLAYFQPVIEELLSRPLSDTYLHYLRHKIKSFPTKNLTVTRTVSAPNSSVQKKTGLNDR